MRKFVFGALALGVVLTAWILLRPTPSQDPQGRVDAQSVLLVPGYGGDASSLQGLAAALTGEGYKVAVADIGNGQGDLNEYASTVATNVKTLAEQSNGSVHVIGFSAGGVITRLALFGDPSLPIGRIITLGSPHYGTSIASIGAALAPSECPLACQQLARDSEVIGQLPAAGSAERWLAVYTPSDSVVRPVESALLEGAAQLDIEAHCGQSGEVQHGELPNAAGIFSVIRGFLAEGVAPPAGTGCS